MVFHGLYHHLVVVGATLAHVKALILCYYWWCYWRANRAL